MIAALATAAMLAPRKKATRPTPVDGRSAPMVIATAIVPGPVVNGSVKGKNASCIGSPCASLLFGALVPLRSG